MFIRSASFLVALLLCASAYAGMHGHARTASARAMFNIGIFPQDDYAFINFLQEGDDQLSPVGTAFSTGACYWNTILDANGWPNNACANGQTFGGGWRIPSSTQFSGQYTLDGFGLGVMVLSIGTQFTLSSGVQCAGVASGTAPNTSGSGWGYSTALNGTIVTSDSGGTGFCIPFTNVGQSTPQVGSIHYTNTCSTTAGACVGAFIKNVRLYEQRDYTRLASGKVFRTEFLQTIATMDPSAIRFMAWGPGSPYSGELRYENRPQPTNGTTLSNYWGISPPYTVSSGTNLVTVAAVTGTPTSMTHGEVATFRFGNSMNLQGATVSAVSNANPGEVTTSAAHGFATGDVIIHDFSSATNMPKLNLYPVCVTVIDSTHYTMQVFTVATNTCTATNVDTTTWGTFSASGTNNAIEYVSLNVGARLNAPLVDGDGVTPIQTFYTAAAGSYVLNAVYDKNSCAITDGSGNPICGAWLVNHTSGLSNQQGGVGGYVPPVPIEMEVEYINEINALLSAGQQPVALWINLPHMALVPTDPDYTTASDYPLNMAKTIISGTYPLCSGCPVIFEDTNEFWNFFYTSFSYFSRQNFLRYGITGSTDFGTLRSVQMFEDIHNKSGVYNPSVVHFAMMGGPPPAVGDPTSPGSGNYSRIFGDATIMGDARWPNSASPPYAYIDYFGYAPYVAATAEFYTANFITLSGNWCTAESTACALTPPFAPNCTGTVDTTYCQPFVSGIWGAASAEFTTIVDMFNGDLLFKEAVGKIGKTFLDYEGGANWSTCYPADNCASNTPDGQGITTAAERNYMIALYQSQSWAQAWSSYCAGKFNDTSAGGCGNLDQLTGPASNFKFSLGSPDTFGSTNTEGNGGNGLIPLWGSLGTINTGQP